MTKTSTQKIFAGVFALAMVLTLVVGVTASSANAQVATVAASYSYTRDLTVGSTGADVTALQQMLYTGGYLKVAPTGYFGSLTKAALAAWQAAVGISPAAGYFGPVTRAYVATNTSTGTVSTVPGCMAGSMYSSTTGAPCTTGMSTVPGCMAGSMFSSTTGAACTTTGTPTGTGGTVSTTWTPDGTNGSVTASNSAVVSSSQTVNAGQTSDFYAVKLQAIQGKVAVNRFDVYFSDRPWLDFTQLTLHDTSGNVIATLVPSPSNVTEVTVGSSYLVRFTGFNYVIPAGGMPTLVVGGTVVSNSTHLTSSLPAIRVSVPTSAIQTINGLGYSNTTGVDAGLPGNGNTLTLSSTGGTSNILARISPSTPLQRIVTTQTNQVTSNVILGVFSLQSQNQAATINSLSVGINTSSSTAVTSLFQNLRLVDSSTGTTYGASTVGTATTTFTNLSIPLTANTWKDLTVEADVQQGVTNVSASTTLFANTTNIIGVDSNYNTPTITAGNVFSSDTTFLTSGIAITNASEVTGSAITNNNSTTGYNTTMSFTVTNNGTTDAYISKKPSVALGTSSAGTNATTSSLSYVVTNPSTYAGDTLVAYDIPAGTSRTFTYTGVLTGFSTTIPTTRVLQITQINFGTGGTADGTGAGQDAQYNVNFGLSNLVATASF